VLLLTRMWAWLTAGSHCLRLVGVPFNNSWLVPVPLGVGMCNCSRGRYVFSHQPATDSLQVCMPGLHHMIRTNCTT